MMQIVFGNRKSSKPETKPQITRNKRFDNDEHANSWKLYDISDPSRQSIISLSPNPEMFASLVEGKSSKTISIDEVKSILNQITIKTATWTKPFIDILRQAHPDKRVLAKVPSQGELECHSQITGRNACSVRDLALFSG